MKITAAPRSIMKSLLITIKVTHKGKCRPNFSNERHIKALIRSNLSPRGSKTKPAFDCCLDFLAIYPSTASEITATIKIPKANSLKRLL
jgi:hypothetical protein